MSKLKIMFVDEEPDVDSSLRSMMDSRFGDWDQTYVSGGEEALSTIMTEGQFDVIVTDIRQPQKCEADLFKEIGALHPETIHIALAGAADNDMVKHSLGFANRCLMRPSTAEEINSTIIRSLKLRTLLKDEKLHKQVANIRSLPTPTDIYLELIAAIQDPDASSGNVARIIARDVGLTAKLLQILNSAFFGLPTRVTDVLHAVTLLGLETVQSIVISAGIFNSFAVKGMGAMTAESLSNHSIRVGSLARSISRDLGLPVRVREDALLAGMLHDVGKLVELTYMRDELKQILDMSRLSGLPFRQAELAVMDTGHCELGAHLLSIWGLPDPIIESVAFHHEPGGAGLIEPEALATVHIADALLAASSEATEMVSNTLDRSFIEAIGLSEQISRVGEVQESTT
ncbi:MAG: HDOD domain-containing protein [bacterium]|nr:HDOD domain-containing protein [bacterium]